MCAGPLPEDAERQLGVAHRNVFAVGAHGARLVSRARARAAAVGRRLEVRGGGVKVMMGDVDVVDVVDVVEVEDVVDVMEVVWRCMEVVLEICWRCGGVG